MSRSSWIWIAIILAVVVLGAVFWLPGSQPPAVSDEDAQSARGLPSSAQVQERLQQLGEARSRTARDGQGGKVDVPSRMDPKRNIGPAGPPSAPGANTQEDDGAEPPVRGVINPEFIDPQPEDIPTLKTMALQDADPQRRLAAVTLLGASDDPDVIPVLAQALSDQDEDVRMAAVQSLADFTGEAPVDAIETALNDPSADVRYEALEVLSDIGGDRARRAVQRALNDPDEDVQELAQSILEFELDDEEPKQ